MFNLVNLSVSRDDICINCSSNSSGGFEPQVKCSTALPILLLIVGVIEGIISLILLSQKSLRQLPLRRSLQLLCIASSTLLILSMPRYAIMCTNQMDIRHYSLISCVVHRSLTDMMLQLSATTVAFISLERYLAVVYPYVIPQTRVKVERIGLLSILTFSVIFNSHYFFTVEKIAKDADLVKHCHLQKYYEKWVLLLMSFVQTYIPFLVILISNVFLIRRLYALKRKRIIASRPKLSGSCAQYVLKKHSGTKPQKRSLLIENEKIGALDDNMTSTNVANQIEVLEMVDVKEIHHVRENMRFQEKDNRRSREAKVAQLILIITASFLLFYMPYECYYLLLKQNLFKTSNSEVDILWVFFMYLTYCYQLFVFPIYILYHPVIRAQLFTWFRNKVNRHENTEKVSISKQRSENVPRIN